MGPVTVPIGIFVGVEKDLKQVRRDEEVPSSRPIF